MEIVFEAERVKIQLNINDVTIDSICHIKGNENRCKYGYVKVTINEYNRINEDLSEPADDMLLGVKWNVIVCNKYMLEIYASKTLAESAIQYMVSILELMVFCK